MATRSNCSLDCQYCEQMSCPVAEVHISSCVEAILSAPYRGEPLLQFNPVKSVDLPKLTEWASKIGHFCTILASTSHPYCEETSGPRAKVHMSLVSEKRVGFP